MRRDGMGQKMNSGKFIKEVIKIKDKIREILKNDFAKLISKNTDELFELEFLFASPERRWRADIAFPRVRVAIEIDGGTWTLGRHNRPGSVLKDMEKGNGYAARGWLVFHTPWEWIEDGEKVRGLKAAICQAIIRRQIEMVHGWAQ